MLISSIFWFCRCVFSFFSSILVQETPEADAEEFALRLVDLIGPAAAHVRLPARESQGADGSWVGLWQRSTFFEKRRKFHRLGIFEDMLLPLSFVASVLVVFFSIGRTGPWCHWWLCFISLTSKLPGGVFDPRLCSWWVPGLSIHWWQWSERWVVVCGDTMKTTLIIYTLI